MAFVYKVFGAIALLVAVVALMSGPNQAAKTAGSSLGTVGITLGAIVGGAPDFVTGFNVARQASDKSGINQQGQRQQQRPNRQQQSGQR